MTFPRPIIIWLASLLSTAVAVIASYFWFDRPIALWVHYHLRLPNRGIIDQLSHTPNPILLLAATLFLLLGLLALLGRPLSYYQVTTFICCLSVIFSEAIKNLLKFFFGRTWPETWVQNNPSFIGTGTYGFHFMHAGRAYQSFPSGHMAATCAVTTVLWILYPRLRLFYVIVILLVSAGLVGANYHFLSDVIAGAFVGISTGWMATAIWNASTSQHNSRTRF
jgi:membrane-associated phospholipid phosphatase